VDANWRQPPRHYCKINPAEESQAKPQILPERFPLVSDEAQKQPIYNRLR